MANTGIASLLNAAARVERFLLSRGTSCPLLCTTHADWVGSHNRYNAMEYLSNVSCTPPMSTVGMLIYPSMSRSTTGSSLGVHSEGRKGIDEDGTADQRWLARIQFGMMGSKVRPPECPHRRSQDAIKGGGVGDDIVQSGICVQQ